MTENVENIILEHLRAIRAVLSSHSERLDRIEIRLSTIEQTLGGLYAMGGTDRGTLDALARRIERRLDLSD